MPAKTLAQGLTHGKQRGQGCLRRFAIAGIGHAFAAPGMAALADLRQHRDRLGLGAAADAEGACDRPALDSGGKKQRRLTGSHFKIWQFLNRRVARRNQLWLVSTLSHKAMAAYWMFIRRQRVEPEEGIWTVARPWSGLRKATA